MSELIETDIGETVTRLNQRLDTVLLLIAELSLRVNGRESADVWYYDVRFPLTVPGLYPAEYWDTHVKRWVGPEPSFSVKVPLEADQTYEAAVQVIDFISAQAKEKFHVLVDGVTIAWTRVEKRLFKATFTAARTGATDITLCCPESLSPRDLNPASSDKRKLAFSFSHIRVRLLNNAAAGL